MGSCEWGLHKKYANRKIECIEYFTLSSFPWKHNLHLPCSYIRRILDRRKGVEVLTPMGESGAYSNSALNSPNPLQYVIRELCHPFINSSCKWKIYEFNHMNVYVHNKFNLIKRYIIICISHIFTLTDMEWMMSVLYSANEQLFNW